MDKTKLIMNDKEYLQRNLKVLYIRQVLLRRGILRLDSADMVGYGFDVPKNGLGLTVNVTEMDEGITAVYAYDSEDWEGSVEIPAGSYTETFGQICMAIDTLLNEYAAVDTEEENPYNVKDN